MVRNQEYDYVGIDYKPQNPKNLKKEADNKIKKN